MIGEELDQAVNYFGVIGLHNPKRLRGRCAYPLITRYRLVLAGIRAGLLPLDDCGAIFFNRLYRDFWFCISDNDKQHKFFLKSA